MPLFHCKTKVILPFFQELFVSFCRFSKDFLWHFCRFSKIRLKICRNQQNVSLFQPAILWNFSRSFCAMTAIQFAGSKMDLR